MKDAQTLTHRPTIPPIPHSRASRNPRPPATRGDHRGTSTSPPPLT